MSDRDPARIETDLQATRARLGANLDELTRRLSPGQLLDEGLAYLRTNQGADFARNLGTQVRENPLPVAIAGLGIGWLALSSSLGGAPAQPRSRVVVAYDRDRAQRQSDLWERASRAGEGVTRMANETDEAFRARVAEARAGVLGITRQAEETGVAFTKRVQEALDQAQRSAQSGLEQMRETAGDWAESARSTAQGASAAAGDMFGRGRERASQAGSYASHLAESGSSMGAALMRNPVLLSAIGVTAGALFGALLPPTDAEREYMGGAAGDAARAAREKGGDLVQRGAQVAKAAVDAGYQAAQDQGLAPGEGGEGGNKSDGGQRPENRPQQGGESAVQH